MSLKLHETHSSIEFTQPEQTGAIYGPPVQGVRYRLDDPGRPFGHEAYDPPKSVVEQAQPQVMLQNTESVTTPMSASEFGRQARIAAGIWDKNDKERPFDEEWDLPKVQPVVEVTNDNSVNEVMQAVDPEDTSPSADNRELYVNPTFRQQREMRKKAIKGHIGEMRQKLQQVAEESPHRNVRV